MSTALKAAETASDEADVIAANEKLTADLASAHALHTKAQADLNAAQAELAQAKEQLAASQKTATEAQTALTETKATLEAMVKERDTLKAANSDLTAKLADFNKAVAAKVAEKGIAGNAASFEPKEGGKRTLTEECLERRATRQV